MTEQAFDFPIPGKKAKNGNGKILPSSERLPAVQLAPPKLDSKPAQSAPIMCSAVDDAAIQVIGEIDTLIQELERLKQGIIANSDDLKAAITTHFALGAEAMGFCDLVRDRIADTVIPVQTTMPDAGGNK